MEARTDFNEASHASAVSHRTLIRRDDTGDQLEHGRFTRTVEADQANRIPLFNRETHVVKGTEVIDQLVAPPRQTPDQTILQGMRITQRKFFDNVINANNFSHHSSWANLGSMRLKETSPKMTAPREIRRAIPVQSPRLGR